jgi:CHASE3 domain sensor protein
VNQSREERLRLEEKFQKHLEHQREYEEIMRKREEEIRSELKRLSNELECQMKRFREIPVVSFISERISSWWAWLRGKEKT